MTEDRCGHEWTDGWGDHHCHRDARPHTTHWCRCDSTHQCGPECQEASP